MTKIKSVTTTTYQKIDDQLVDPYKSSYIEYDEQGNVVCAAQYHPDGEIESKTTSKYNEKGQLVEQSEYFSEEEVSEKAEYLRDETGQLQQINKSYADGSESIITYEKSDKQLEITSRDEDDELDEREVLQFDDEEHLIVKELYDWDNKLKDKYENTYDENGRLVEQKESTDHGNFFLQSKLTYDNEGRVLSQLSYNRKGELTHKIMFKYDEKGRVVEQQASNAYIVTSTYDDENHTQTETRKHANGIVESEKFSQYGEHGNILKEEEGLSVSKYGYEFYE